MARKDFSKISSIVKNDTKSIFSNPIVMITLLGIIILPSLYAILNIQACWDPYGNTGELEFAIANLDEGASYDGVKFNVGNQTVEELKNNTDFDWVFVSEKSLRQGVKNGTYYAGIVIPKNFSEDIISITSDNPVSANLEYVVNKKTNPMASRLSDSAAKAVYNHMNAKIVEIINLAALDKLGELQSSLSSGASQLSSGASQLSAGSSKISSGASQVSSGVSSVSSGASEVSSGADAVSSGSSDVSSSASQISSSADKVSAGASKVSSSASQLSSSVDSSKIPSTELQNVVNGSVKLANSSSSLAKSSSDLAQGSAKVANGSSKLANSSVSLANGASSLADGSVSLAEGALSLAAGSQLLASSSASALYSASSALSLASSSLSDVTGVDNDTIGNYIYSPVKLDKNELYPVTNYGSEVSPFYIVLSIWVGAVITCVMLKPGYAEDSEYSTFELYFGKLAMFIGISLLQATVTLIGCFALGIDMDNPLIFVLSTYLISMVFMVICYSIIASLGNVGKAITIIFLVLQISSTGGIYPIQLMDPFFQIINPFMPMTYAITMLRESLLGFISSNYLPALGYLVLYGVVFLFLGVIVKKLDKRAHHFEECLKESGLF